MCKLGVVLVSAVAAVLAVSPALAGPTSYTYDPLGRVKTVTYDNGHKVTYSYDANDNRTQVTGNAPPIANPQSVTTAEDTAKAIMLTSSDVDGDPRTYAIVTGPAHGTLSGTPPSETYKPNLNFNGADSFTFKTNDGTVDSAAATVSISVTSVNDAPTANPQSVTAKPLYAKAITLTGSDVDGDPLTYKIVTQPAYGTLSGTPPNVSYYTSSTGSDSFTFKVNDGHVDSSTATVSITVQDSGLGDRCNPICP